jgi:ABC-type lipoprotein release transport system permease subunit
VALRGVVVEIVVAFAVPGVLKSPLFGAFDARYVRLHVGRDLGVAMLITYVSEYRASSVDPMQALRGE